MPPPRMAIVYPTYGCNHRCRGCDYAGLNRRNRAFTREQFRSVLDQLTALGVSGVEFCGGGEPTLHPDLPEMMERLARAGVAFGLLTNGTALGPALRRRLVRSGAYCRVSLESASEKMFNAYKRPASRSSGFSAVLDNVRALARLRDRERSALQLSLKYSVGAGNSGDLEAAAGLAAELRADSLQFKLLRNVPDEIKSAAALAALSARAEALRKKYPRLDISHGFAKSKLKGRCWVSPLQLTVDPLGDVYICCYYRHRAARHRLGNLLRQPLERIWYSPAHLKKLRGVRAADCNKYDCRFHAYNELLKAPPRGRAPFSPFI
jgi:MoaA/NifB/PqqE/SkfB family radical SAM enzyme